MRFPLTEQQALILVRLIQNKKLLQREIDPFDMVVLTQVGAIKMTKENNNNKGLTITNAGRRRFIKWARKHEMLND
tara:strand:+ start:273 stop:500 length:228 start_codon:yes stop_codon:yes gene_type:complete